jgi:hypothetical protein
MKQRNNKQDDQYRMNMRKLEKLTVEDKFKQHYPDDDFIDEATFCELMNISQSTAQEWRHKGIVAHSNIIDHIYYRLSDVKELLDNHRHVTKCRIISL